VPLAVCRVLFFAWLLLRIAPDAASADWASVDAAFWLPTHLFVALQLEPASPAALRVADVAWTASLALACLGLWTRASTCAALLLGVYVLGLPQCFGKVDHWSGLLVLVLLVLALARCGDALSLDAWLARRDARGRVRPGGPSEERSIERSSMRAPHGGVGSCSGEYRWPIQLVRLTMVLVFFAAGVAKLRFGGRAWFDPTNMAAILVQPHYALDRSLPALGLTLAGMKGVCAFLAAATVAAETAAPLALVGGTAAAVIVGTLFLMQLGNAVLLGVHASFPYLGCYAFWLPWQALVGSRSAPRSGSPRSAAPSPGPDRPVLFRAEEHRVRPVPPSDNRRHTT
jgi:hypothetical protein